VYSAPLFPPSFTVRWLSAGLFGTYSLYHRFLFIIACTAYLVKRYFSVSRTAGKTMSKKAKPPFPHRKKQDTAFSGILPDFDFSIADKRKKRNMTRSLDGFRQFSLMLRARSRHSAGQDLCALRGKLSQPCDILIVDLFYLFRTEHANLFSSAVAALADRLLFSIHRDETSYSLSF